MADFRAVPATDGRFVWVSGELDVWSADDFTSVVASAIAAGGPVVLDLARLTFVDSDGIRALLQVARRLVGRGCLILHNPTPHVAKVLRIVGISEVRDIHLLDTHTDSGLPFGPGAWGLVAAMHHVAVHADAGMARARAIGRRNEALRHRTSELMAERRAIRRRLAPTP